MIENITKTEIKVALPLAVSKLCRIIAREGDDIGERLKPEYLRQLILEQIQVERFKEQVNEKRNAAYANAPFIATSFYHNKTEMSRGNVE